MKFFKQLFCKHNWNYMRKFPVENYFVETGYEICKEYQCLKCNKIDYNVR